VLLAGGSRPADVAGDAQVVNHAFTADRGVLVLIQKLRLKRGWSQQHLADASGLSARTIQRLEAGAPASLETLKSLAAVFEVDVQTLQNPQIEEPTMKTETGHAAEQQEQAAFTQVRMLRSFYLHLIQFIIINAVFLIGNYLWFPTTIVAPIVTLCWGSGLLIHAIKVWVLGGVWEKGQVEKRLGRPL